MTDSLSHFETSDCIARLRARDEPTFRALVRHYHRRLLVFATACAGRELAEEVVQEAWLSIWKALPGYAGTALLKTWIYTIVRNEASARRKREGRIPLVQLDDERFEDGIDGWLAANFVANGHWNTTQGSWNHAAPEQQLEAGQLQDCLQSQVALLPERQQAVFMLRDMDGLELDEVCNILGVSDSNCRVLLHRARLRLLQVINHYQSTGECRSPDSDKP